MINTEISDKLPSIQLVWNQEWKTVEVGGQNAEIPSEWTIAHLSQISTLHGGIPAPKEFSSKGRPFIRVSNLHHQGWLVGADQTREFLAKDAGYKSVPEGTLLVAKSGESIHQKYRNITSTECVIVGHVAGIEANEDHNIHYLRHHLKNKPFEKILAQGGATPSISMKDLGGVHVFSMPLPEQTLIAQVLTAQESQVHDLRKLAQAERQRLAWLSEELLSGRLRVEEDPTAESVVVSRNEKGEPAEVLPGVRVVENLGWKTVEANGRKTKLPKEWRMEALESITECLDSHRVPLSQKDRLNRKGNTPYWGANNIVDYVDGHLLEGKFILLGEDAAPFFDKTKKVSFVVEGKIWPNNHIHVLNTKESHDFLCFQLNRFDYSTVLNTVERPKLTQSGMKSMSIPLAPRAEQTLIAQVLTAQETQALEIERLADLEQQRLEWLSEELLSGRIRAKTTKED